MIVKQVGLGARVGARTEEGFGRFAIAGSLALFGATLLPLQGAEAQSMSLQGFAAPPSQVEAVAVPVRWSTPECSYSVEFPGEPEISSIEYPRRPGAEPGPDGPAAPDLVVADYPIGGGGKLSAGCASVDRPLSRGALQAMVYGASSAMTPVRLDNGPCLIAEVAVECARMEAVLLQREVPVVRTIVTVQSDGRSVFFTRVVTPLAFDGAELGDVEESFVASIAPREAL